MKSRYILLIVYKVNNTIEWRNARVWTDVGQRGRKSRELQLVSGKFMAKNTYYMFLTDPTSGVNSDYMYLLNLLNL